MVVSESGIGDLRVANIFKYLRRGFNRGKLARLTNRG